MDIDILDKGYVQLICILFFVKRYTDRKNNELGLCGDKRITNYGELDEEIAN